LRPRDPCDMLLDVVYFEVVNPRPENKYHVRLAHRATSRSEVIVKVFPRVAQKDGHVLLHLDTTLSQRLELCGWLEGDRFKQLVQELCALEARPGGIAVQVIPQATHRPLGRPMLMNGEPLDDGVDSDDGLPGLRDLGIEDEGVGDDAEHALALLVPNQEMVLPAESRCIVEQLLSTKSFAENGKFLDAMDMNRMNVDSLRALVDDGVVMRQADEFGADTYALQLAAVRIAGAMLCSNPLLLVNMPFQQVPLATWSKLELVVYLLRRGWSPVNPAPDFLRKGGANEFSVSGVMQAKSYLRCMCMSSILFNKPGGLKAICHKGVDSYYLALLNLPNLGRFAALGDDDHQELKAVGVKAILDDIGEEIEEQPLDEVLAIEDGDPDDPIHAEPVLQPTAIADPFIECRVGGMRLCKAYFDNYTHASGHQRCFVACSLHTKCRLYVFVKDFPSKNHAVAHCFAWLSGASRWPDRADQLQHVQCKPTVEEVATMLREQFG
jgi:hypothetical protein